MYHYTPITVLRQLKLRTSSSESSYMYYLHCMNLGIDLFKQLHSHAWDALGYKDIQYVQRLWCLTLLVSGINVPMYMYVTPTRALS